MRILLTPFGSRGDVQPLLALSRELAGRGHSVRVGAATSYRSWVQELGLEYAEIGGDAVAWLQEQQGNRNALTLYRSLIAYMRAELPLMFRQTVALAKEADLIVTTLHLAAPSAAEYRRVPCRTILYSAGLLPSAHEPPPGAPWPAGPPACNRLAWWGLGRIFNLLFKGGVNRERGPLGLPPVDDFLRRALGEAPIVAADRELAPLPPDSPAGTTQTAALLLAEDRPLPLEAETFLAAGPPPVYIGFGSTPRRGNEAMAVLVSRALAESGLRGIWSPGHEIRSFAPPPELLVVGPVSHQALFPRLAAVIHHGGAGTTATALRAGVPQIVVPQLGDQHYHARRLAVLGVAPAPLPRRKLDADRLASLLREVVANPAMRTHAMVLADQLREKDGVGLTADLLLTSASRGSPSLRS